MSVVNDMLKDLETRWPDAQKNLGEGGVGGVHSRQSPAGNDEIDIPRALSSSKGSGYGRGPWVMVITGVAVFALVVAGNYLWTRWNISSEQPVLSSLEKVLVEGGDESTVIEVAESQADPNRVSKALLPTTVVREGEVSANQVVAYREPPTIDFLLDPEPLAEKGSVEERIIGLMAEGDAAFRLDRLTTPKEDNAYDRYSAVLALRPDHEGATKGIEQVRSRYLEIVEIAIIKKYYYKVPELIRKARELGVSQTQIDALIAGLPEKDGKPTKEVLQRIAEYEASRGKTSKASAQATQVEAGRSNDASVEAELGDGVPELVAATSRGTVVSSKSQRDTNIAQEAQKLIAANQLAAAQFLLEKFIESNPQSIYSYREMFNLRLRQGKVAMAEAMIKDADHIPGGIFSYMVAQLLIYREDYAGALRALQSQSPLVAEDPSYHALKAGVLHKLGQHQAAVVVYRDLLRRDQSNATYWLGLAVALDADNQKGALAAFQRVQQFASGSESFLPYVRSRIGQLASNR
tara:strand:- start:184 stop:1743 length:1560 start_codon:yes stop_codon:yes gene_type:complete